MKANHRKVGLISTMSPDKTWKEDVLKRVANTHHVVKTAIEKMGFEVLDEGPIHREYKEMLTAGRNLRARGINALIIYVGTWTYANCSVSAALEADVPVVIWGDTNPGTAGLVGSSIVHGAMKEIGVYSWHVYGSLNDENTLKKIKLHLLSSCAARGLRGQVLGVGGSRSMGMVTAVCDPNEWRIKFGIEVDGWEQVEVIDRAEHISEEKAKEFLNWMKKTFGKIIPKDEVILKQIKLYLALLDIIRDKDYDFIAVKCLPELPEIYTTFCLAHAILNDKSDAYGDKESFVCACEADVNGALTMQIMKLLSGGPVMFTDLTQYDLKNNLITMCNCGSQPTDFATSKKEVYWEKEGVHEFKWRIGGTCPQYVAKEGAVTLARLGRIKGEYVMMITTGDVVEMPREKLKETVWERPHAFVKPRCSQDEFIQNVLSNHIHFVYGDYSKELIEVCNIMKIKPII